MDRRTFLSLTALTAGSLACGTVGLSGLEPKSELDSFDFVFLTDTHIEPEVKAADGCSTCFKKIRSLSADFAIHGGDHVFDVLATGRQRADSLYKLYIETEQAIGLKVHHAIGNHDVFGVYPKSGVSLSELGYAKRMYEDRLGPTYYSFDHKGYHFIVLDAIHVTDERSWEARIDSTQLVWLRKNLDAVEASGPVIVVTHVPLVTGAASYGPPREGKEKQLCVSNAFEVLPLFAERNVLAVLQGHTHINEVVTFRGIPFVSSGAVCGNWWHGTRWGTPEGFTVVSLRSGKIDWRYETYGFKSVDPQNT